MPWFDEYDEDEDCSGCPDCEPVFGGDDEDCEVLGEPVEVCTKCKTVNKNLDLLGEFYVCKCGAEALRAKDPDHPIFEDTHDHHLATA